MRSWHRFWNHFNEQFLKARSKKSLDRLVAHAKHALKRDEKKDVVSTIHRKSYQEQDLIETYAKELHTFFNAIQDVPIYPCLCCNILQRRHNVRCINKVDYTGHKLLQKVVEHRHREETKQDFICDLCLLKLKAGVCPPRACLNDLCIDAVPPEIANLNTFEQMLIQQVKSFQTCIRLGVKAGKRPPSEMVRASRGTIVHLPLPLQENVKVMNTISAENLNIIVNGLPTRAGLVWQHFVRPKAVLAALKILKAINPLYKDVVVASEDGLALAAGLDESELVGSDKEDSEAHALLRAIDDQDQLRISEQFTVQPIDFHDDKEPIARFQQLMTRGEIIDARADNTEYLSFPHLYPTGRFGRFHARNVKLGEADFCKTRFLNADRRFARDAQYLFWSCRQSQLKALMSGVYHFMQSVLVKKGPTAGKLITMVKSNDQDMTRSLSSVLGNVRGTSQYWIHRYYEVRTMMRAYGPPTWFVTASAGDYAWQDLDKHLRSVNADIEKGKTLGELCVLDPVTVSRHFKLRQEALVKFLKDAKPLGAVDHHFVRLEYQARGAGHYHCLLWNSDAPVLGQAPDTEVKKFIEDHVTCEIPDPVESPEMYQLVEKWQTHRCGKYCIRKRTFSKSGKTVSVTSCRFGFPRPETNTLTLSDPAKATVRRSRMYQLARRAEERCINDYNPALLLAWKANVDVSYIADKAHGVAGYTTGYITKSEKSHLEDVANDIKAVSESPFKAAFHFGAKMLSEREMGAYEAADFLLGTPLYTKSDPVKYVDVTPHGQRRRRMKHPNELKSLASDSTEVFEKDWLFDYYPNRPDKLEDMSFHDFASRYNYLRDVTNKGKLPGGTLPLKKELGYIQERSKPYLINHKVFNPSTDEVSRERYYHCLLFLHLPYRDESLLLGDAKTYEEAFKLHSERLQQLLVHHHHLSDLQDAMDMFKNKEEMHREQHEKEVLEDAAAYEALENKRVLKDRGLDDLDAALKLHVNDELAVESLNADQKRVFERITSVLAHQSAHARDVSPCQCENRPKSMRLFVSGCGGTGKSYLINVLRKWTTKTFQRKDEPVVAVCAPTGLAAHGINGITLHRLLQLPVEHGRAGKYYKLPPDSLHQLRNRLRDLRLLIVDEVSMVSNVVLMHVHLRLHEILGLDGRSEELFGGLTVVFFGDLLQLNPVKGGPVFQPVSADLVRNITGGIAGSNLWADVEYDELTINVRQQGDNTFADLLARVRTGSATAKDHTILKDRVIPGEAKDWIERAAVTFRKLASEGGHQPVFLLARLDLCKQFNSFMLSDFDHLVHIPAIDDVDYGPYDGGNRQKKPKMTLAITKKLIKLQDDASRTAGLESMLSLANGCRIMVRRNVDLSVGLVNGALGTICKLVQGNAGVEEIHIKLDRGGDVQALTRVGVTFELSKGLFIRREQFPIIPSYAITIHKSQSLTLDSAIMSLGDEVFASGMAYVALSRVRSLDGVHLVSMEPSSMLIDKNGLREYNRLRSTYRKDLPLFDMSKVKMTKRPKARKKAPEQTCGSAVAPNISCSVKPKSSQRQSKKRKNSESEVCPDRKRTRRQPGGSVLGLKNLLTSRRLGAPQTCYLNACLQCVSRTKIGQLIATLRNLKIEQAFPVVHLLSLVVAGLRDGKVYCKMERLWEGLQSEDCNLFSGGQKDLWDAFDFLVQRVDECLQNLNKETVQALCTSAYTKVRCCPCHCNDNYRASKTCFVQTVRSVDVDNCLNSIARDEDQKIHECPSCDTWHSFRVITEVERPSEVLLLRIGRMVDTSGRVFRVPVNLPPSLTMKGKTYHLVATASHSGDCGAGHCTANIFHCNRWWLLNDASVSSDCTYKPENISMAIYE